MGIWAIRWPNGDCAIVSAASKAVAYDLIDEVGDPGGAEWFTMPDTAVFLKLGPEDLELETISEQGHMRLMDKGYPILMEAMDGSQEEIEEACRKERVRLIDTSRTKVFSEVVPYAKGMTADAARSLGLRHPDDKSDETVN